MRKLVILFSAVFLFLSFTETKALDSFWYNWYATSTVGQLMPNEAGTLNVRIYIQQGNTTVYQEVHTGVSTDQFAIFSINVGMGTPEGGPWNFASLVVQADTRIRADVQRPPAAYCTQIVAGLASVQINNIILPGNINLPQNEILIGNASGDAEAQPVGGDLSGSNTGSAASLIINNNAVTSSKIASNAVTSAKIADGTIINDDIANGTITNAKLVNSSLTVAAGTGLTGGGVVALGGSTTLSLPNVGTAGIYGSATQIPVFTTDAQGRVSAVTNTALDIATLMANLTQGTGITPFTYDGSAAATVGIAPGGVTATELANDAVTTAKILNGNVTNAKLANSSLSVTAGTGLSGGGVVALGGSTTLSLPNVGTAGIYGSATQIPVFTTDAQGRVSAVTNTALDIATLMANLTQGTGITPFTYDGSAAATVGIATGGVTATELADNAVTNAKIASTAEFINVQNSAGSSQFSVDNADRTLRFEGTGDVTVAFDASTNKVSVNYSTPPLPPDLSGEPFLVYSPASSLPNSKVVLAGNAFGIVPGAGDFTYNVLYDGSTIGKNVSNQLYLMDNAVTASKINNDPLTGDKLIQVINNAGSQIIDAAVLPGDIVYLDTTPATGDIDGTFGLGLNIANDAVTTAKILNANVTYAKLQNAANAGRVLVSNGAGNSWVEASVTSLETDPVWTAAEPNYGNLTQNETITGNWVNTANPWADNEVADNLTINGGTITNTPISGNTGSFTTLAASSTVTFSGLTAGNYPTALVVDNAGVVYKSPNQGSYTNIVDKSANYSATSADGTILVDCSGGSRTITLPAAAANLGLKLCIKKVDASANSLVVSSAGGNIDGVASKTTIVPNQGFVFQSNGTNWYVVGIF